MIYARKNTRVCRTNHGLLICIPWTVLYSTIIFLGALLHQEICAVGFALLASLVFVAASGTTNQAGVATCLWLLLLQNAMIGIGAHLGGNASSSLSLLTQVPYLLILALFFGRYIFSKKSNTKEGKTFWALILCVDIILLFFIGNAELNYKLVSIRNVTMFYMGYKLACSQSISKESEDDILKQIVAVSITATIVGILMMIQDIHFWQEIGIYEVYIAKQSPIPYGTLGGRFYTSLDGVNDVLRMGSLYYEPVNLAYLLLAGLISSLILYRKRSCSIITVALLALGLFLTFGKGGYMLLAILVASMVSNRIFSLATGHNISKTRLASFCICFLVIGIAAYSYYRLVGGPVKPHFWAIEQTLSSIIANPFGHGLGTGGNMSVAGNDYSKGAESAVMSVGYQLGVIGVVCLLMMLYAISKQFKNHSGLEASLGFFIPLCLFSVAILQENTFSPQCIFPFMALLASLNSTVNNSQIEEV